MAEILWLDDQDWQAATLQAIEATAPAADSTH
jgi:hypothetical protein